MENAKNKAKILPNSEYIWEGSETSSYYTSHIYSKLSTLKLGRKGSISDYNICFLVPQDGQKSVIHKT